MGGSCGYKPLKQTFVHVPLVMFMNLMLGVAGMFFTMLGAQQADHSAKTTMMGIGIMMLVFYGVYLIMFLYFWCYINAYQKTRNSADIEEDDLYTEPGTTTQVAEVNYE